MKHFKKTKHNLKTSVRFKLTLHKQHIESPILVFLEEFYAHQSVHRESIFKNIPTR
jgi:hypothetical protein